MAKDPAFLFYSSDFLSGISDLTMEERGQYITLLCLQHQKGSLNDKTIRLMVGSVSVDVISKFEKDENGNFFNKRLVEEIEKRNKFTESRRNNGSLGGRPKENKELKSKPKAKPKNNHMDNHMEDVNENVNRDLIINKNYSLLDEKILQFLKFRKEMKKPILETSKQSFLNKLMKLSGNNETLAIEILEQSMANGWQGIFELKQDLTSNNNSLIDEFAHLR